MPISYLDAFGRSYLAAFLVKSSRLHIHGESDLSSRADISRAENIFLELARLGTCEEHALQGVD